MTKFLKTAITIFSVLLITIVLLIVLAFIVFPGEKIKKIAEEKASGALGMPVSVGGVGLTFVGVPAMKVTDITIGQTREGEPVLFSMKSAKIRVNLVSLLRKRVEIVSVELEHPEIFIINREDGSSNLPKEKSPPQEDTEAAGLPAIPLPVTLNILTIRDANILLDNRETTGSQVILKGINARLNLDVSGDLKRFNSTGKTSAKDIIFVSSPEVKPLSGISAEFVHEISGDLTTGDLVLSKGVLSVNELPLMITATVAGWTKTTFKTAAENLDIERLLKAVPDGVFPESDKIKGKGSFSLTVEGSLDTEPDKPALAYHGRLTVDHAALSFEGLPKGVDDMTSHITFTEKDIDIADTMIRIGGSNLSLSGTVTDYAVEPAFSLSSSGVIDLDDITDAFPLPDGVDASGIVALDVKLDGVLSDLTTFAAKGELTLSGITAVLPEMFKNPVSIDGHINITPAAAEFEGISIISGTSDMLVKGRLENYMTLAGLGKTPAVLNGTVSSNFLDLNELLVPSEKKLSELVKLWDFEETLTALPIPQELNVNIAITSESVVFGRLKADSVKGQITYKNGILELDDVNVSAYAGSMTGKTTVNFADPENVTYTGYFKLNALESASFIADFFGIGDVVRGKLSSSLQFAGAGLDSVSMLNNLTVSGSMDIYDGQFVNWDFTKKLGEHLKFLDFETLDFQRITNTFRVEDRKVFTPDIAVKTQYGDITLDGFTGFDTTLDYTITLLLNEKASRKAVKQLSSFSKLFTDKTGQFELTVFAKGTITSPSFKLDTSKAEAQLREKVIKEVEKFLDKQEDELQKKGKELLNKLFK